jgi:hypothetical protein
MRPEQRGWVKRLHLGSNCSSLTDGCYDPADFNEGLLLGIKGTLAHAELHFIRPRPSRLFYTFAGRDASAKTFR